MEGVGAGAPGGHKRVGFVRRGQEAANQEVWV